MTTPVELDLIVQRHAPFPSIEPWTLLDEVTGMPIDITGATIVFEVRDHEGAAIARINKTLPVVNGPAGQFGPPPVTEAEHEALPPARTPDTQTLSSALRLRWDVKMSGVAGWPAAFFPARGYYIVQTGVNL